ncbi:hypothetical protein KC343_g18671 [Hortaea werneckii]|uniref:SnoaL-like domain-containing protein n=1 Tax=Hortaea werneckii TaxID=91943 RepID=A0A3M7E6Q5_HORWE|nr:hypothetical protein KC352_g34435 [Hortaea werneckii]KAI7535372.1 hypothetical protein KC317_g18689 [Hortaea werneckii]KAI7581625.1 hypothetical protein KC346_g18604 [Hortaea werneckii]KAI7589295.1 hypothetical protein KC343_g18671 [Hortaea werneckii]KAI7622380.1 hypothetical protein KC319_g18326 [Hortaea werneckii]
MSTILANTKHTAHAVCDGYERWEMDAVMAPRAHDCIHHLGPKSLARPLRNNEQYRAYFHTVQTLFQDFKIEVADQVFDEGQKKAALHVFGSATSPVGKYEQEYTWFLTFSEDGTKVKRMEEMIDSAYLAEFFKRLNHYVEVGGGQGEAWADSVRAAYKESGGKAQIDHSKEEE